MSQTNASLILVSMFALRCIVPLVLTVAIGTWMNKLVARWEAADKLVAAQLAPASTTAQPAKTTTAAQPTTKQALACWLFNNCEASDCPAYGNEAVLCWQQRLKAENKLPDTCADCEIYNRTAPAI